ncbi:MAG: cytochrome P450 [Hyphomicrobiaceae bacterium]|nr:cytochrome P450 [Hyphomicrobiaceae bacterium]
MALGLVAFHLTAWILCHPFALRPLFALLRRVRPVAVIGSSVLLANGADAREVLKRFDDFTLGEVLSPRMTWGPFLLTIDWRDQHDRERALFQSMVAPEADVRRIRALAAKTCEQALAEAKQGYDGRRQIDVVQQMCELVVVAIAESYFGIPTARADVAHTGRLLREIAGIAMVMPPQGSARDARAKAAIAELTHHIEETVGQRALRVVPAPLSPVDPAASLLERLVTAARATDKPVWLDDDFVRRYVAGLAATGGATIVRATTNALYEILRRPRALRLAVAAAEALDQAERAVVRFEGEGSTSAGRRADAAALLGTRRDELRQILYEGLRFRPMLPLLLRYTPRDTLLAKGTSRQRLIRAGMSVVAAPMAVMFDPAQFAAPGTFLHTRSLDDYVHFGFGPRTCFGKYVADTAMLEIARSLLCLPGLTLAEGWGGTLDYDGPVANSLTLTFAQFQSSAQTG